MWEKTHIIKNNSLVNNHNIRSVGKMEKNRKSAKKKNIIPTQSQAYNTYKIIQNPKTNSQTIKKQSYASITMLKLFQALKNLWI